MTSLTPLVRSFVAHFGEMGSRWGINRTVGQIYALIFVAPEPLHADDIAEKLEFSRSNVSMGLKELQAWRLVNLRHVPGDRREYFDAPSDAWEIFRTLAEERRRREIEPTIRVLGECLEEAKNNPRESGIVAKRLGELRDMMMQGDALCSGIRKIPRDSLMAVLKSGSKWGKLLGVGQS